MFRLRWFLVVLLLLAPRAWAETLLPYQPENIRQICAAASLLDRPGGTAIAQLAPGSLVTISGIGFDASGQGAVQVDRPAERTGFVKIDQLRHFCPPAHRLLAPPNSCHLVLARPATVDELNRIAQQNPRFLPMMTAFQTRSGYALTGGPVNLLAASAVLTSGQLPAGAECATGADFTAPLDRQGDRFAPLPDAAPPEAEAQLRWRCQQGEATECDRYTRALWDSRPHDAALLAELARFDLLGCMGGSALACEELMKDGEGWINKPLFTALPDAGASLALMGPELGKIGCDAGRIDSCALLGRPAIQQKTDDPGAHLTALLAYLHACRTAGVWTCDQLADLADRTPQVLGAALTADDEYALAEILFAHCDMASAAGPGCDRAFTGYARFAAAQTGDTARDDIAQSRLQDGCAAQNIIACIGVSNLDGRLDPAARRTAAAQAQALCKKRGSDANGCGGLAYSLAPDLPEARSSQQARYDEYAAQCAQDNGQSGRQACMTALTFYRDHLSTGPADFPEALLRANCRPDRITGCAALADAFNAREAGGPDGQMPAWAGQPEQRLAALQMGCKAGTQGMSNCASLGLMQEKRGDFAAASAAYALGCASAMFIKDPSYQGDHACFWGGEHAMKNTHDYATARRYLAFICDTNDWEMTTSACTMLGKMEAAGQGGPADLAAAMARLERGCFYDSAELADLEGCMLYGDMIMENRDHLDWNESGEGVTVAAPDHVAHGDVTAFGLSRASHAYLRACSFAGPSQEPGCTANRKLLAEWSRGDYPRMARTCRVQNAAGKVTSEKPCQQFVFYVPEFMADGEGEATIYVWPDGDRTVTRYTAKGHRLNDAPVGDFTVGDDWICWTNATSGNRFCIDATQVEY